MPSALVKLRMDLDKSNAVSHLSVRELVKQTRSGELTAGDVASAVLARSRKMVHLNALVASHPGSVMREAAKLDERRSSGEILPLHGLPILVKDNINAEGFITTAGTPALAQHRPRAGASVVQKLVQAGAMIVAKTNLDELAAGVTGSNRYLGPVRNPYDRALISGGSSSGSAAGVSGYIAPIALGTDTGGSSRIPASLCGVVGFRPTIGRYPNDGVVGMPRSRATIGLLGRFVGDISLVDQCLISSRAAAQFKPEQLRLGIPSDPFFTDIEDSVRAVMEQAFAVLAANDIVLIRKDIPGILELSRKISAPVALQEAKESLVQYLAVEEPELRLESVLNSMATPGPRRMMQRLLDDDAGLHESYHLATSRYRPRLQQLYSEYFADDALDAMIYPTTCLPARPVGDEEFTNINGEQHPTFDSYIRNCDPGANAGLPSVSIPAGMTESGLPVGLSVDSDRGLDARLLRIAEHLQSIIPPIARPG